MVGIMVHSVNKDALKYETNYLTDREITRTHWYSFTVYIFYSAEMQGYRPQTRQNWINLNKTSVKSILANSD